MREVRSTDELAACAQIAGVARPFQHFNSTRFERLLETGKVRLWLDPLERGFVSSGGTGPEFRVLRLDVDPEHRRVGIGGALFEHAFGEVPAGHWVRATTAAHEAGAAAFASAIGLHRDPAHDQGDCAYACELKSFEATATPPPGIRLLPLGDVGHPRLNALMLAASEALPYSHALHDEDDPLLLGADPALSLIAVEGDEPVALTLVRMEGPLPHVLVTFVQPAGRRRGVARALKEASLTAMEVAGHRRVITDCLADNLPTRRLNESLGFFETTLIAWTSAT